MKERVIHPSATEIEHTLANTPLLSQIADKNVSLKHAITELFLGSKSLLIGGESGMGKSLILGLIRTMDERLPVEGKTPLSVITWDRLNKMIYDQISIEVGTTVNPPDGEVPFEIRQRTSKVLVETIAKEQEQNKKLVVESPFLFDRGEKIFTEAQDLRSTCDLFYIYSPQMRLEILETGRDTETAGQLPSMTGMRRTILTDFFDDIPELPQDQEDQAVLNWLHNYARKHQGNVIPWNPNEFREDFTKAKELLIAKNISPDFLKPISLGRYAMTRLAQEASTIPNLETLI